jgi:hypothetical protein
MLIIITKYERSPRRRPHLEAHLWGRKADSGSSDVLRQRSTLQSSSGCESLQRSLQVLQYLTITLHLRKPCVGYK